MIDRVHRRTTDMRPSPQPSTAPRLAQLHAAVFRVADLSDRRTARGRHAPNLTAGQGQLRPTCLAGHQRGRHSSTATHRRTLSRLHLDGVHAHPQRNLLQGQAVADLRRHLLTALHVLPLTSALRAPECTAFRHRRNATMPHGHCDSDRTGSRPPEPAHHPSCGENRSGDIAACDHLRDDAP